MSTQATTQTPPRASQEPPSRIEIGEKLVVDGEIRTIRTIKGRWVKLDDDTNISRAEAQEYRNFYLEDAETLGEELGEEQEETETEEETGYQGSMIRLRERQAAGAYQKAPNGQPCCMDRVATLLGTLTPMQVIEACMIAMALPSNPYVHLNMGQQSMNLRNKLRGCFKREEFGFGVLVEAVEEIVAVEAAQKNAAGLLSDAQWQTARGNTDNLQDSAAFLPSD